MQKPKEYSGYQPRFSFTKPIWNVCFSIVITTTANQYSNDSCLDTSKKNLLFFRSILLEIKKEDYDSTLLIVHSTIDILITIVFKASSLQKNKVFSFRMIPTTARLKHKLGNYLNIDSHSIHAFIIGKYSNSEIAVYPGINVSRISLYYFYEIRNYFSH